MLTRISNFLADECCLYVAKPQFDLTIKAGVTIGAVGAGDVPFGSMDADIYRFCLTQLDSFDTIITADSDFRDLDRDHRLQAPRPKVLRIPRRYKNNSPQAQVDEIALVIREINCDLAKFTNHYFNVRSFAEQFC